MAQQRSFVRHAALLLLAVVLGLLFFNAYREQELWKVVATDGASTAIVGQQRWFGLTGIHLVRRASDGSGRAVRAKVVGHADSWSDAKVKANDLHRESYGCDSPPYFEETIRPLVAGMAQATEAAAYEGLPHHHWERELLEKELKVGHHLTLDDFPFYTRPVPVRFADVNRLRSLCSAESTFQRWRAPKACGGFHPDWCLLWNGPAGECRVVLCFGCSEARLYYGTEGDEIWSDLDKGTLQEFVAILQPYRTNRPVR